MQYAGRILRSLPGKTTAEVHDYHDVATGVLAASLSKRAPGCTSLGFPHPGGSLGNEDGGLSAAAKPCAYVACRPSDTASPR